MSRNTEANKKRVKAKKAQQRKKVKEELGGKKGSRWNSSELSSAPQGGA